MPNRSTETFEVCADQFVPPFVVVRIVPVWPSAQHVLVLTHDPSSMFLVVPEVCDDQSTPPSVDLRIVPEAPNAKTVVALGQAMPWTLTVATSRLFTQLEPFWKRLLSARERFVRSVLSSAAADAGVESVPDDGVSVIAWSSPLDTEVQLM